MWGREKCLTVSFQVNSKLSRKNYAQTNTWAEKQQYADRKKKKLIGAVITNTQTKLRKNVVKEDRYVNNFAMNDLKSVLKCNSSQNTANKLLFGEKID